MPHIIVNYSANLIDLDEVQLLERINSTLLDSKQFVEQDIKSRIFKDQSFLIGINLPLEAYIHLKLYLLSGRTAEQKKQLGEALLQALKIKKYLQPESDCKTQICV
ncbi:5-carboxymethyl-2-hydroxymuconate Delta-isomerase [Acinetobacter junii]|uniref:5-carboxymethyl-2-hydroxymuconate Delta-isomerase n=1 Tax=Acinetobacter junii TaxID=40215 RepID=UPI002446F748|nr:5-carboxymethyl-2-hydroxymuconate Delta-isomerase [Acinetobacter junii]MDH0719430.1 5-carboxymethyl-2-hydroxymuconate Delta-isomerase [Acinetobacter junii]